MDLATVTSHIAWDTECFHPARSHPRSIIYRQFIQTRGVPEEREATRRVTDEIQ